MNRWLEGVINTMPDQYYWVRKRFRSRPKRLKKVIDPHRPPSWRCYIRRAITNKSNE
jgi:hypothetical protein